VICKKEPILEPILRKMIKKFWNKFPSYLILVIIFSAAIYFYLYASNFQVAGFFHDDGIYIVNAESLYQGTRYSIASLPASPPQTKYPPMLPLIISLVWHINPSFPENVIFMRLFSCLCAILVLPLAWLYIRQKSNYTLFPLFFFLSALAFNPHFALFSGLVMSEIPFTLFSMASIALFLHYGRCQSKSSLYGSLILATIAFYTRTIGIALFFSFLLWFGYKRRFKDAFKILAFMLSATIPWFYWVYRCASATESLATAYYSSYFSWVLRVVWSWSSFLSSFLFFPFELSSLLYIPPFMEVHSFTFITIFSILFYFFFLLFFLKGVLYQLRKSPSVDTFYLLITMVIVYVWPWDKIRFFIPLLPVVLFHLLEGIKIVKEDITTLPYRNFTHPLWQLGVATLLIGIYVMTIPQTTRIIRKSYFNNEILFHRIEEACNWIQNNTEKEDIIASNFDPLVYLFSGRHAVNVALPNPLSKTMDEDDILKTIKEYKVDYLLIFDSGRGEENKLRNNKLLEIMWKYPEAFYKCYEKEKIFAIYGVKRL
jgi:hypothetical protein